MIYLSVLDAAVSQGEPIANQRHLSAMRIERINALTMHARKSIHLMIDGDNISSVLPQKKRNVDAHMGVRAKF